MQTEKKVKKSSFLLILLLSMLLIVPQAITAQLFNSLTNPLQLNPLLFPLNTSLMPIGFYPSGITLSYPGLNELSYSILNNPLFSFYNQISPISEMITNPLLSIASSAYLPQITLGFPAIERSLPNIFNLPMPSLVSPITPMRAAAQGGTWIGTWESTFIAFIILFNSGPMTLTLIENPLLQTLSGTCILTGSRFTNTLIDVRGVITTPTFFELSGITAGGFALVLSCTLLNPAIMTGSYTVTSGFGGAVLDRGIFNLTLL